MLLAAAYDLTAPRAPAPIALWRVYLLRLAYLIMAVGLALNYWPDFIQPHHWELNQGVVESVLMALSQLAILGLRYPLKMLPLLFFEMTWKAVWLIAVGWPMWRAGNMTDAQAQMFFAISLVVIFPFLVPWDHVAREFLAARGDRWR
jgi:hypothetical protein